MCSQVARARARARAMAQAFFIGFIGLEVYEFMNCADCACCLKSIDLPQGA